MTHQYLILIFVLLTILGFFLFLNGGIRGSVDRLADIFRSNAVLSLLFFGLLLLLLIVFGSGVTRDGLTILDILLFR